MNNELESTACRPSLSISWSRQAPGSKSAMNKLMPLVFLVTCSKGVVRARSRVFWAYFAFEVQTFWPEITQSSRPVPRAS